MSNSFKVNSRTSTGPVNYDDAAPSDVPGLMKARFVFAFLGFLGVGLLYALRVNLSVAIVSMVKPTTSSDASTSSIRVDPFSGMLSVRGGQVINDTCVFDDATGATTASKTTREGDFAWNEEYQGFILSGFFYGYAVGQFPGGLLSEMYGGKIVFGLGVLGTAVFTVVSPFTAYWGGGWFFTVRLIEGLFEGVTFPAIQYMIAKWAPPAERSRFATVYTGGYLGTVIALPLSGLLCDMDFLGGWPLAFYVFGGLGILWYIPWHFCVFDTPDQHPRIDPRERRYIEASLGTTQQTKKKLPIPWGPMLRTKGLWACASMHLGIGWQYLSLLTCLPTYMAQILHYDIKSNSALSSIPYVVGGIASVIFGLILDWILKRQVLKKLTAYKIFNAITALGPAISLFLVTLVGCDVTAIMILLAINGATLGAQYTGNSINLMLLAPNFSGAMLGISNTFANGAGIVAPLATGILTNGNQTMTAWNIVFYISSTIGVLSYVFYYILCEGEVQPWNDPNWQADTKAAEEIEQAVEKPHPLTAGIENPTYQS